MSYSAFKLIDFDGPFPYLTEEGIQRFMQILDKVITVVIFRGLGRSGKSFLATEYVKSLDPTIPKQARVFEDRDDTEARDRAVLGTLGSRT